MNSNPNKLIVISTQTQDMHCFADDRLQYSYKVSTAKNGVGEIMNSECTPRGWHRCHSFIGEDHPINSVFVGRVWTKEIYSDALASGFPERDWILTRIIRLDGLEPGRNKGGEVDSFNRFIYIHGTPDTNTLGIPGSHGCIRMNNKEIIALMHWATADTLVYIK